MEAENRKMKEMIEKLERLDTNLEEMKISTLTAELACSKAEEDQLHRKFQADNEWGDYLRQVQEDQRLTQELITKISNENIAKVAQVKKTHADEEETHLGHIKELQGKITNAGVVAKGIVEQVTAEEKHQEEVMKRYHMAADDKQEFVDEKERIHADNIRSSKEKAALQREKMSMLKLLPQMFHDIEDHEEKIEACNLVIQEHEKQTSNITRNHYLDASKHKEDIWELNKDLDMLKAGNMRVQNRMDYGLRNPFNY